MHRILAFIAIGVVLGWLAFRHYKKQKLINAYLPVLENHDLAESNILIRVETRKNKIIHTLSEYYSYFGNSINRILLTSLVPAVFGFLVNKYFIKQNPLLIIMIVEVSFFFVVIGYLKKKKRNTFVKEFLTILNGLSSAVSSGQSINQAIHYVSQKYEGMVSYQFKQLHNQLSSGEDINTAFVKASKKLAYPEFHFFVVAMKVNLEKGGELDEILNNIYKILSDQNKLEGKKLSMTAEARMSALILAMIPVGFLILLKFLVPENFDYVFFDDKGKYILYYMVISEFIGMSIIKWLMSGI